MARNLREYSLIISVTMRKGRKSKIVNPMASCFRINIIKKKKKIFPTCRRSVT